MYILHRMELIAEHWFMESRIFILYCIWYFLSNDILTDCSVKIIKSCPVKLILMMGEIMSGNWKLHYYIFNKWPVLFGWFFYSKIPFKIFKKHDLLANQMVLNQNKFFLILRMWFRNSIVMESTASGIMISSIPEITKAKCMYIW